MNMKKIIITALLALVWVAGSSQEAENDSIPDGIFWRRGECPWIAICSLTKIS